MAKRRIAVLGAGMGSLSAVYALTSRPGWQDDLDITVYQLGWRLGGKAASGRVPSDGNRSLEHGYHVLLGFYDNAFAVMRDCYRELGRSADATFAASRQWATMKSAMASMSSMSITGRGQPGKGSSLSTATICGSFGWRSGWPVSRR